MLTREFVIIIVVLVVGSMISAITVFWWSQTKGNRALRQWISKDEGGSVYVVRSSSHNNVPEQEYTGNYVGVDRNISYLNNPLSTSTDDSPFIVPIFEPKKSRNSNKANILTKSIDSSYSNPLTAGPRKSKNTLMKLDATDDP